MLVLTAVATLGILTPVNGEDKRWNNKNNFNLWYNYIMIIKLNLVGLLLLLAQKFHTKL